MKRVLMIGSIAFAGCSGAGMGDGVRRDVSNQMQSATGDFSGCYKTALEQKRKLRGRMVLAFDVAPKTGAFEKVRVVRDDVGSRDLSACVVERVGSLKLAKPQSTVVSVDSYPVEFAPTE